MDKIEKEKEIMKFMVCLYCKHKLKTDGIPKQYVRLVEYASQRLDRCRFGNNKSSCTKCPIHCYRKDMRSMMREVMKWSGPRMFLHSPLTAIRHFLR